MGRQVKMLRPFQEGMCALDMRLQHLKWWWNDRIWPNYIYIHILLVAVVACIIDVIICVYIYIIWLWLCIPYVYIYYQWNVISFQIIFFTLAAHWRTFLTSIKSGTVLEIPWVWRFPKKTHDDQLMIGIYYTGTGTDWYHYASFISGRSPEVVCSAFVSIVKDLPWTLWFRIRLCVCVVFVFLGTLFQDIVNRLLRDVVDVSAGVPCSDVLDP